MTETLTIPLFTSSLCLREVSLRDWHAVLHYQSKAEYLRYSPWKKRNRIDVQKFLQLFIDWQSERPRAKFQMAITLQENNQLIGLCGARKKSLNSADAEIGYEIDPAYWGHGYAPEATRAIIDFGFQELHLHRIWATCVPENSASIRVLEKVGLQYEGRIRENRWMKNRWWDTLIYGILEHEWDVIKDNK